MDTPTTWTNWAGNLTAAPASQPMPRSETELIDFTRAAYRRRQRIRVVGTGHSFAPLCVTDGVLFSLDGLQGLISVDAAAPTATFWAGTKIHQVGAPLLEHGLAMANMGDIDRQSLAGAISTATHGTGHTLGNISSAVVGLRLILPSGEVLDCSPAVEPAIFDVARVSLGALGIISQVTLRVMPAYRLHERAWIESFEECLANLDSHIQATRHFEFWWVPEPDVCAMKSLALTTAERLDNPPPLPAVSGRLDRYMKPERIDWSYRVLPSERNVKFVEMEFSVPAANGPDCLREIRALMQTEHADVVWPVEYRTVKADDIPLSPHHGRDSVTISIHQAAELPFEQFFADAEAIFRNHQGRPHWGKRHRHTAQELRARYPRWSDFLAARARLDPDGRCLNEHLRAILQ